MQKENLPFTVLFLSILQMVVMLSVLCQIQLHSQERVNYDKLTNTYSITNPSQNDNIYSTTNSYALFNWQMVQTSTIQLIKGIEMLDLMNGYVSYYEGLSRTSNGGLDWDAIYYSPNSEMNAIDFINIDTGWYVGGGRIRMTSNQGLDWTIKDYPPFGSVPNYYTVFFQNKNSGFVAGVRDNKGYLIKTTNSGTNWQQIYLSAQTQTDIRSQFWINSDTGWFLGSSTLLKTTNAGGSFQNYYPKIPPTSNGYNGILGMCFINEMTGWISGSNVDHKNMYKTTNGGENWVFQDNPVTQYEFAQLDDVKFIDENRGWSGGYSGQIITTTNGGINWLTDIIAPTWFVIFANYSSEKVWCGANNGEVWYLDSVPPISVIQNGTHIPEGFDLKQNYPNPFNSQTLIEFEIPARKMVIMKVYDLMGRELRMLVNQVLEAGKYKINYNAENLSSGVYFYRIETEDFSKCIKFILLK